ncbi:Tetratricopeptide_repeat-containing protein [Hexamita inflata]|uniref:Tetratricopeptide repeat-containing protein n=1 Tax=Hexamita inflata TaxID=28002 RepID=A0AA86TTR3_9EUKA|nr:Tetratricopeptide repeat-containing protein [Hexamita inflata]
MPQKPILDSVRTEQFFPLVPHRLPLPPLLAESSPSKSNQSTTRPQQRLQLQLQASLTAVEPPLLQSDAEQFSQDNFSHSSKLLHPKLINLYIDVSLLFDFIYEKAPSKVSQQYAFFLYILLYLIILVWTNTFMTNYSLNQTKSFIQQLNSLQEYQPRMDSKGMLTVKMDNGSIIQIDTHKGSVIKITQDGSWLQHDFMKIDYDHGIA